MLTPAPPAVERPTLLVFTRGPAVEARRRRLLPGLLGHHERSLHEGCLAAALAAGRSAGCRLLVSSPVDLDLPADVECIEQSGRTFGERLAAAMVAAGPGPLVVVGADVPDLTARPIEQSLQALAENSGQAIVGLSPDGGFYLLAVARPVAGALSRVRWCRRDTATSLARALEMSGFHVTRLAQRLADLDRPSDLSGWLARPNAQTPLRSLLATLRAVLAEWGRPRLDLSFPRLSLAASGLPVLRGPPN